LQKHFPTLYFFLFFFFAKKTPRASLGAVAGAPATDVSANMQEGHRGTGHQWRHTEAVEKATEELATIIFYK
jgi:hypothetical protein